jgi:hypothetical protein
VRPSLLLLLVACAGDEPSGECTAPAEGPWTMNGSCFGMAMAATLTVEADGCSFTFSDWDMAMSSPTGGTVSGDEVTLDWPELDGCAGTTDGATMEGSCGDGCTWDGSADG